MSHGQARRRKVDRRDKEFLPAAIEILETPPSPIRAGLVWLLCLLVTLSIAWAYFGKFDIVATAQGKLQPMGRVKIVQSEETGRVVSSTVLNGHLVSKDDILVELDPTAARAEEQGLSFRVAALRAEIARRQAVQLLIAQLRESDFLKNISRSNFATINFPPDVPEAAKTRESGIFDAERSKLNGLSSSLRAQYLKAEAQSSRLRQTSLAQEVFIATLAERVTMRNRLVDAEAGTRSAVMDATETLQEAARDLATQRGEYQEAITNLDVIRTEATKQFETASSENIERMGQAQRDLEQTVQEYAKARRKLAAMTIRSPDAGVVQTSAITTAGQVVTQGMELMRIVPSNTKLEIEAYLPNRDIGFVEAGQKAVIKVEAFPFTRYGILTGMVTRVATDAIPEPDARQIEEVAASSLQSSVPVSNAQRMQNLVYSVMLEPDASSIAVDNREIRLSPGMSVTVEIKTGRRRILEYLFSPLAEIASGAMKER